MGRREKGREGNGRKEKRKRAEFGGKTFRVHGLLSATNNRKYHKR